MEVHLGVAVVSIVLYQNLHLRHLLLHRFPIAFQHLVLLRSALEEEYELQPLLALSEVESCQFRRADSRPIRLQQSHANQSVRTRHVLSQLLLLLGAFGPLDNVASQHVV